MTITRGEVRRLLITIGELQSLIGRGIAYHNDDRDQNGFQKGQKELQDAFEMCIVATSKYDPVIIKNKVK